MKKCVVACLFVGLSLICEGRPVRIWPYDQLTDKADLIVIGTPTGTKETKEKMDIPGIVEGGVGEKARPVPAVGLETTFEVLAVFKGDKETKSVVLFHLRRANPKVVVANAAGLVSFDAKQKKRYLLFLRRDSDGRYSALTGQTDPDGSVKDLGVYSPSVKDLGVYP